MPEGAKAKQGFVSYLRVSTGRQGRSGLGLEAQREAVHRFVTADDHRVIREFVEIESGRSSSRPALAEALSTCRLHRAILIVAKLDRLTRSVAFLVRLLEGGVEVRFCDLPKIEGPLGQFMLQQMAAVAELEAGMISARTKAALAAAKARGITLGGWKGVPMLDTVRQAGRAAVAARVAARVSDLAPMIRELQREGVTSARSIGTALNGRGIASPSGRAPWSVSSVARLLAQIEGVDRMSRCNVGQPERQHPALPTAATARG